MAPRPLISLAPKAAPWRWSLTDPTRGVLLALVSSALFVLVGALVRVLSEGIGVFQILLVRQGVFVLLLLPLMWRLGPALFHPRDGLLHGVRIIGAFASLALGFLAVSNLPLADATALGFTQVLFVALIARLWLRELVDLSRMVILGVGFAGVCLVIQPQFADPAWRYVLAGLGAALGAAVAATCVRRLAQRSSRTLLLSYQAVLVGLVALGPALAQWRWPTTEQWGLLLLVGGLSALATWLGVSALKHAEANLVSNVGYVQILYALVLGYALFGEVPNALALAGVALLLASVAVPLVAWRRGKGSR
ncbi:DMT family transporter [Ferrimonas balearica]|uniref:DMT family transporter n=1 Tax=Ferrimonas balearica TaxID=44012 RepID=UPI001C9920AB|nr:DMT family transporter [Ferrimonas balearica]MBY5993871.1 DMT family transporter [Ferrimonas balearica]